MRSQVVTAVAASTLIDGTARPTMRDVGVLVDNGSIRRMGPADEVCREARSESGVVFELRGATILPGLIDAHDHIAWGPEGAPGWDACRGDERLLMAWSVGAAQAALLAGITTLVDCGAPFGITLPLRRAAETGVAALPNLVVAGPCITTTGGHGEFLGVTADSADELRGTVRRLCRDRVDFIKIMASGGSMDPETNRRRAQYSVDQLRVAVEEAHRLRRRVVAHCNATESIRNAVEAGVDVIAHCNWLAEAEGMLDYDSELAKKMAGRGVFVDLNVGGAMSLILRGDGRLPECEDGAQPRDRWELLSEFRAAGGPIYLTSDAFGHAIGERFPSQVAQAARRWGLSAEEMVWRTTGLPAQGLGIESSTGSLEPGKRADLLIVDGDLGDDLSALTRPRLVFRSGRLAVRDGWLSIG